MARNKYPEETRNKILDVAWSLFLEKGYDHTSIQDIIDHLGGLSKGAIYHHFKSKEAILLAVYDRLGEQAAAAMQAIRDDTTLTAMERLRKMFCSSWQNVPQRQFIGAMPNLLDNPQFLALHMRSTIEEVVPDYILPVVRQCIAEGSLQCDCPVELSHLLMVLANVWLSPLIYPLDTEDPQKKVALFNRVLQSLGLFALDAGLPEHMAEVDAWHRRKEKC